MSQPLKLQPFDAADHLKDEADVAAYLEITAEENPDDPQAFVRALRTVARARNMSQIAKDAGISREGLYKALADNGNPSFANVVRIGRALGMKISVTPAN